MPFFLIVEVFGTVIFEGVGIWAGVALVVAYLLAFTIKGLFGYGAVPPMILMGSFLMPPHQAVIVAGLVNFTSQWFLLPEGLKTGNRQIAGRMILFILPALLVGVAIFRILPPNGLQFSVGLLLLLILLAEGTQLKTIVEPIAHRNVAAFSAGASIVAGLMAGLVGAGAMIFLSVLLRTLVPSKDTFRGTIVLIVTSILVARTALLSAGGMITLAEVIIALMLLPLAAIGLPLGRALSRTLSNEAFFMAYRWFMIMASALLMVRGAV